MKSSRKSCGNATERRLSTTAILFLCLRTQYRELRTQCYGRVENLVKAVENTVKAVENAVKAVENAVKAVEDAANAAEDVLYTVEDARK